MASPPRAGSPPNYMAGSGLNPARKRPSLTTSGPGSGKRRKQSIVSTVSSSHPLRQTSFPPPENAAASRASSFSPPVDGSLASRSMVSAGRRKRGGRRGGADTRSQIAASAGGTRHGRGSQLNEQGVEADEQEDDADEDEDGGADETVLEGGAAAADQAQLKLEKENVRMLIEAFNSDQSDRYEMWRRVKLNKATVRRLVNQTLSQSVPSSIVTTVGAYTKSFIGELIERARDVQTEWLAISRTLPIDTPFPSRPGEPRDGKTPRQYLSKEGPVTTKDLHSLDVHEREKGPLLPDHLREALRRYKKDRVGGSTGYQGLSLNGRAKTASRVGGKRLFR